MQFCVLGPVEIHDEASGRRTLPAGAKQRALLGALVALAGHQVSVPRLIDELWGEHPPANAANALQAHVARLRRLLPAPAPAPAATGAGAGVRAAAPGPARPLPAHPASRRPGGPGAAGRRDGGAGGGPALVTCPPGYVLRLGHAGTDAHHFHRLTAQGRQVAAHDPAGAAEVLRRALSLWRGPALEGSAGGDICAAEATRLEEHRLAALELLYEASLRAGRHGEIIGELEELTADHPMREGFYDQLMLALYRCGRQAEALGVYDRARKRLVHELGVEPGPVLRERMEAILRHDRVLSVPAPRPPAPRPGPAATGAAGTAGGGGGDAAGTAGGGGAGGGLGGGETVLSLGSEITRLHHRIETLRLQQRRLLDRFEALTAQAGPPAS